MALSGTAILAFGHFTEKNFLVYKGQYNGEDFRFQYHLIEAVPDKFRLFSQKEKSLNELADLLLNKLTLME